MLGHLFMEPYLDRHCKQYKNILTLNEIPDGPLANMVVRIRIPIPSEFTSYQSDRCKYAIKNDCGKYMEIEHLPKLMSFMASSGYIVDYQMSKLLKQYTPGHIICSFTYTN